MSTLAVRALHAVDAPRDAFALALARQVRLHALSWWVAANGIGLLLAVILAWPAVGDPLAPLTYGRWVPLHLNWQLYGWCALPLVGVLLRAGLDGTHPRTLRQAQATLWAWSAALALGGAAWLSGTTSGKLFLDWHGWARPVLPLAMLGLWSVLASHALGRARALGRWQGAGYLLLLAGLAVVPPALFWASGRNVYPAINPHSGGATGASLLGSTLGIIAVIHLVPWLLRVPPRAQAGHAGWIVGAGAASAAICAYVAAGPASHHSPRQILGLAVLLAWIPLLFVSMRRYQWGRGTRPWLRAAGAWWALLVLTGWLVFLPGVSERLKFTNGLVAHAHLAMAGFLTSALFVVLNQLDPDHPLRNGFGWWQAGNLIHVGLLFTSGWWERDHAASFFSGAGWFADVYVARAAVGAVMLLVSLAAWREAART